MRILMITSVYRDESLGNTDTSTNIVNSFVKEWKKQGHEVLVIHNSHCYPRVVHYIPKKLKKSLAAKMGFAIADFSAVKRKDYQDNGVKIFRLPIKKYIPHSQPSFGVIKRQVSRIAAILKKEEFEPDIITGHWASPQMEIISELKTLYHCRTAVVLHGTGYIGSSKFETIKYLANIDALGARSLSQAKQIKELLHLEKIPFVCNSGVPDEYLENYSLNTDKYTEIKTWKITYVGRLVSYKNIDATIKALSQIEDVNWEFNIVGEGASRAKLEELAQKLNCADKVHFWGRVSREKVMQILNDSHIFVMISKNEIFGLVYLEAMAASCLTIASKDGGVDGIIINEKNGFLCSEGNYYELNRIIEDIIKSDSGALQTIVEDAYRTVQEYTDYKVAEKYLKIIEGNMENDEKSIGNN